ncbi:MAG: siphovirus Gp157 family protein [Nitratireductor sp.]|nr:siphovirus Gp157 family protein [Nitratireductor sp.]
MNERSLQYKAEALKTGISQLKELCEGDDELLAGMVEGELDIEAFALKCLELEAEDDMRSAALKAHIDQLSARKKRFDERKKRTRNLIAFVLDMARIPKLELPTATVSVSKLDPGIIIQAEEEIPTAYWKRPDPVLDRGKLRRDVVGRWKALQAAEAEEDPEIRAKKVDLANTEFPEVPGVDLDNGDISVTIRRA